MLREVIVVEGKRDAQAVRRAVEAQVLITDGWQLSADTLAAIKGAYERCGIIILTDPDGPGERIRARLTALFPKAGQAHIPKKAATKDDDVGVEQASADAIKEALAKVHYHLQEVKEKFSAADLFSWGLNGSEDAAKKRAALGAALGIGYGSAKQFLARLNAFGVSRAEVEEALAKLS